MGSSDDRIKWRTSVKKYTTGFQCELCVFTGIHRPPEYYIGDEKMAMPDLPEFDPHSDPRNVSNRWTKWVHDFRAAMVSFKITCKKRQRALLKYYGGEEFIEFFDSLEDTGTDDEIEPAIEALTRYFTPAGNCEENEHRDIGHAQDKECNGNAVHGEEIHHFTRCCSKNTYKRESNNIKTGNDQNTHTGKETEATHERKSPTREVKQKKSPTREVKQKKSPTREVKQKSPTRKVKLKDSHKENSHKNVEKKSHKAVNKENSHKDVNKETSHKDVKKKSHKAVNKENSHKDVNKETSHKDVKKKSHKAVNKENSHKRDVKQNDSHKGDVKSNDSHKGDVKPNDSHKDVKPNDSHKGDVKQNDSHKDVKPNDSHKNDSHKRDVKQNDSHKRDVKCKDSHKRDLNKINRKHVRKRVAVDQNLHKRRDVNKIHTGDQMKQETTAVNTVIWKINNVAAGKSVKKKQIIRRKKGNERHSAKKSHVKYNIIAGNKVLVKSEVYKSDLEPPDVGDQENPEQVVILPCHHHKSRPPNSSG